LSLCLSVGGKVWPTTYLLFVGDGYLVLAYRSVCLPVMMRWVVEEVEVEVQGGGEVRFIRDSERESPGERDPESG
jgi:hypothetical protein